MRGGIFDLGILGIFVVVVVVGLALFSEAPVRDGDVCEAAMANPASDRLRLVESGVAASEEPVGPNLVMLPPRDLYIQLPNAMSAEFYNTTYKNRSGTVFGPEKMVLRLGTEIRNLGSGPLHLKIIESDGSDDLIACQQVYMAARGLDEALLGYRLVDSVEVGAFEFHYDHGHLHHRMFSQYTLLDLDLVPVPGANGGRKIGFCLFDHNRVAPELQDSPYSVQFPDCEGRRQLEQGISVGWNDFYPSWLIGQEIDITDVADGIYYLVSAANTGMLEDEPSGRDNFAAVKIKISSASGEATVEVLETLTGDELFGLPQAPGEQEIRRLLIPDTMV